MNYQKAIIFLLTFLGYASLHSLRQGWSYSKSQIELELNISKEYLGIVDALYLVCYSAGMGILGSFIHKFNLKIYIIIGLVFSSLSYMMTSIIFSISGYFNIVLLTIFMCFNGFFQSTGWPGMMGIFGNWFQKNKKGVIMGVWAMNGNFGNIIASSLCNLLENNGVSWVWNFILTGLFVMGVALLIFIFLKEKPQSPKLNQEQNLTNSIITQEEQKIATSNTLEQPEGFISQNKPEKLKCGIFSVLFLPRVPLYVLGYACLKGCMYGLLFWLPYFFDNKSKDISAQKGYISAMIDIGSLIGGFGVGFLIDKYEKRTLFLFPLLLISSILMFLVSFSLTDEAYQYYIAMFMIGCCIGGPYNIIGTVIAIDIGKNIKQKGSVTKVSSLIQGSAALFTALSMIVIPLIAYESIFYLFSMQCIIATITLIPVFLEQLKSLKKPPSQLKQNESLKQSQ